MVKQKRKILSMGSLILLVCCSIFMKTVNTQATSDERPTIVAYNSEKEIASKEEPLEPRPNYIYKEPIQEVTSNPSDTDFKKNLFNTFPKTSSLISTNLLIIGFLLLLFVIMSRIFFKRKKSS